MTTSLRLSPAIFVCFSLLAGCSGDVQQLTDKPTARYTRDHNVSSALQTTDLVHSMQITFAGDDHLREWMEAQQRHPTTRSLPSGQQSSPPEADRASYPAPTEQAPAARIMVEPAASLWVEATPLEGPSRTVEVDSDDLLWDEQSYPTISIRFQADLEQMTSPVQEMLDNLGQKHGTTLTLSDLHKGFTWERVTEPNQTWSKIVR